MRVIFVCERFQAIYIARLACELHGSYDERGCLFLRKAFFHKALDRRLIARARHDVRTRAQIVEMDVPHEIGTLKDRLRRPQRVVHREAARLQLRCKRPVKYKDI